MDGHRGQLARLQCLCRGDRDLEGSELGVIELKTDCAFVAVHREKAEDICQRLNNERLKKKKVRIRRI